MTSILGPTLGQDNLSQNISTAAKILQNSGLVAFPTETLYGLGADATNDDAVISVYKAKKRPIDKPLMVLIENIEEAANYVIINDYASVLANHFWPGPITLIFKQRRDSPLSHHLSPKGSTIALRVPGNRIARQLIKATGSPLTGPSANVTGFTPPKKAQEVLESLDGRIDAILDGGECPGHESTLIDISNVKPRILRQGIIRRQEIEGVLGPL